jgi:RNA polymerase sigma-70 factor (ECF subfamily)
VIALNRAAAIAMASGPETALPLVDDLGTTGELDGYYLFHATRADLLRRLGRREEAAAAYERTLELVTNDVERSYLQRRLSEVRTVH